MTTGRGTTVVTGIVVAAGLLLAVGCSSGDGEEAGPTTTAPPGASTTTPTTTTSVASASSRELPTTTETAPDLPGYNLYRPEDLDATGEPLPVVVWANGGCVRHDATWQTLLERWAGAGFFVIAITQPAEGDPATSGTTTAADQALAIDWAEAQDAAGSPYAGHLDTGRVVAAGNSCGGITSLGLAATDDRVRSVFVLSGSSVGPGAAREQAAAIMSEVSVPVGFAVGGDEDIASTQAVQDYEVLPAGVPAMVAQRSSGDHVMVSTTSAVLADVAEIGIHWMDLTLYGTAAAGEALAGVPCPDCAPDLWTVTAKHLEALTDPAG